MIVLQEFLKLSSNLGGIINFKPRVIIQGYGNVGMNLAKLISSSYQFTVVAISDKNCGIYLSAGLDFEEVNKWHIEHGSFIDFPHAEKISNSNMLLLECDILVPGAIEDQITADNAGDIRTKMVLELANEAVTDQGAEILKKRNE